jgi:haloalkane dehalogenase
MPSSTLKNTDWRAIYPFASHWADLPTGRMHYIDESPSNANGDDEQETLLFVHGNPTWSFHWRHLITGLRDRYRRVAVDHIGCGLSEKPARFLTLNDHIDNLCAFVDQLNLDRVTLIAQDWGGAIGLGAMLRRNAQLKRIILFNTGAFPPRYIPWRIRACRGPVLGRLGLQGANLFSLAALRMTLSRRKSLSPDVAAGYLAPYDSWAKRQAVYGFVRDIPTNPQSETWRTLAKIEAELPTLADRPTCLIWGMRDWCFRPDCLERFIEAWPNVEVHRLADVGHWVVEDALEDALSLTNSFLVRASSPPTLPSHRTPSRSSR